MWSSGVYADGKALGKALAKAHGEIWAYIQTDSKTICRKRCSFISAYKAANRRSHASAY